MSLIDSFIIFVLSRASYGRVTFVIFHFLSTSNNQVLATLHDYPCLSTCVSLLHYISICVRLAWKMANHVVPYYLDQDITVGEFITISFSFRRIHLDRLSFAQV